MVYSETIYDALQLLATAVSLTKSRGQNTTSVNILANMMNLTAPGLVGNVTTDSRRRVDSWFSFWIYSASLAAFSPVCEMPAGDVNSPMTCSDSLQWPDGFPVPGDQCVFEQCLARELHQPQYYVVQPITVKGYRHEFIEIGAVL